MHFLAKLELRPLPINGHLALDLEVATVRGLTVNSYLFGCFYIDDGYQELGPKRVLIILCQSRKCPSTGIVNLIFHHCLYLVK